LANLIILATLPSEGIDQAYIRSTVPSALVNPCNASTVSTVGTPPEPPEIVVELLALLVGLISAPEFFREFAAPAQETDFVEGTGAGAGEVVDVLGRLLMRAGTKSLVSAYRSVVT
jgi:hypothetical protein